MNHSIYVVDKLLCISQLLKHHLHDFTALSYEENQNNIEHNDIIITDELSKVEKTGIILLMIKQKKSILRTTAIIIIPPSLYLYIPIPYLTPSEMQSMIIPRTYIQTLHCQMDIKSHYKKKLWKIMKIISRH